MICVGIGRGRHRHVIAEHKFLAEQGVKLVELRLDYIQGPVQVKRLLRDRPCPVIVTCRRAQDGGRWEQSEEARRLVLRTAIVEGAEYVDLEDDIASTVPRYGSTKRIVSHHDFHKTPNDLIGLHRQLSSLDADIIKIATMANQPEDSLRVLELMQSVDKPTIGLCMGDIGMPTRVLAGRFGAPFTYATFSSDRVLAPGQIGWREMRDIFRYETISKDTKIFGVVADPVGHSLSPVVHNKALDAAGIDAVYLPFRVSEDHIDAFLDSAERWSLVGLSVTIPHKQSVLRKVKHCDELVTSIGAVNTLSLKADGVSAFNTDATAAIESLKAAIEEDEIAEESKKSGIGIRSALILGSGGVARALAFVLRERNVEVTLAARTVSKAEVIAAEVGCKVVEWDMRHRIPHDCIINATPIGMHPNVNDSPFPKSHLQTYMIVFDTVYNPENTLLIKHAQSIGCRTVTGVDMFIRQAAHQFSIWHDCDAPEAVMRDALKRATASAKIPD